MIPNGIANSITTISTAIDTVATTRNTNGTWEYDETASYTFDAVTTPATTAGAATHDWGTSGYTLVATGSGATLSFTLTLSLNEHETGSQTVTATNPMTPATHTAIPTSASVLGASQPCPANTIGVR